MRALPGVSLIEVLAALATTATLLSLLVSFLFQIHVGQRVLDRIDPTQNAVQRNLVPFLAARLTEVALVQDPVKHSTFDFELTRHSLSFVSRFLPPSPFAGLRKVSITNLGGAKLEVSISDWPKAVSQERVSFSGITVEFRGDYSGSIIPELPSTVQVISGDQEFIVALGSELPVSCVSSFNELRKVDLCGELKK